VSAKRRSDASGRIAVAIAGAGAETRALETLSALTGNGQAQVSWIVIEDADLLRAARLPFAIEVCRATNIARRIDADDLQRRIRERAATLMHRVRQAPMPVGVEWTFDIVRQRTATAVLELAQSQDVTLLFTATTYHMPRVARGAAPRTTTDRSGNAVVVVLDQSAASRRALSVAHRIGRAHELPVIGLIVAASEAGAGRIRARLSESAQWRDTAITTLLRPSFEDIAAHVRRHHPATLVLPVSQLANSPARIAELESGIDCPTAIVR
jgi:hypothetical protein